MATTDFLLWEEAAKLCEDDEELRISTAERKLRKFLEQHRGPVGIDPLDTSDIHWGIYRSWMCWPVPPSLALRFSSYTNKSTTLEAGTLLLSP